MYSLGYSIDFFVIRFLLKSPVDLHQVTACRRKRLVEVEKHCELERKTTGQKIPQEFSGQ